MKGTINLKGQEEEMIMPDTTVASGNFSRRRRNFLSRWKGVICIVIAAIVLIAAVSFISSGMKWKAVFLTNNQVYFGHFWDWPFASTITLRDVYYLQINQLNATDQSQLKLVKLGSEIHGPTNEMVIPLSQILFYETLRSDSAIVKTINGAQ